MRSRWVKILVALVAIVGVAYVAVPWVYIHVLSEDPPPKLSFEQFDKDRAASSTTVASTEASGSASTTASVVVAVSTDDGIWIISAPSTAGYRVKEVIAGQDKVAVGRTSTVDGSFTVAGTSITNIEVNVDLASMASDSPRRDEQFRTRIMSTDEFPVATFTFAGPLEVPELPADGAEPVKATLKGTLSLRGTEHEATFEVSAKRTADSVEIVATTDIVFADYAIPNPSIGPISTEDHGVLEVSLTATRQK
jgi:polyisoprenoid-binding protein YceI